MGTARSFDRLPSFRLQNTFNVNIYFLIAEFILQSKIFSHIDRYHRSLALVRAGTQPEGARKGV